MISIIVPVYCTEKHIRKCIDSILAHTITDWELLLVDDGSIDNSGLICDEYASVDDRIRVFHQVNGGVSKARNKGIDASKGEYVTFADSDDYLEPYAFMSYINAFEHYDADIVRTGFFHDHENGVSEL